MDISKDISRAWHEGYAAGKFEGVMQATDGLFAVKGYTVRAVVLCKDCRYKSKAEVNDKGFLICSVNRMEITDNDFCSYGERKEGDDK